MRIILDTNVLVSALIQRSYPYFVVDTILAEPYIEICISEPLLSKYINVFNRDKFSRFPEFHKRANEVLTAIENRSLNFEPTQKLDIIDDSADNRLLELADTCAANFLITGNTNDFTMSRYKTTEIISPKNFFELLYTK